MQQILRGHEVPLDVCDSLQEYLDARNDEDPPTHIAPWFSGLYRHKCPKARVSVNLGSKSASTPIDLKERYVTDESGTWAIIYREGKCKLCGETARSKDGCLVETVKRPPISGRVARAT